MTLEDDLQSSLVQSFLWSFANLSQAKYNIVLEENLLPFALTMFPKTVCFQQDNAPCQMPHSQVSEGVDEGPPHQDPVMASPISRPESH